MAPSNLTTRVPFLLLLCFLVGSSALVAQDRKDPDAAEPERAIAVHYLEIVTPDPEGTCKALAKLHGVTFGEPVESLGGARTTRLSEGSRVGVRAPMHAGEVPVVRPYVRVDDLDAAFETVTAIGGIPMVPPTTIEGEGRFALYMHGGIEHGIWQP